MESKPVVFPAKQVEGMSWLLHQSAKAGALTEGLPVPPEQTFEHFKTDKGVEMYRNLSSSLQILKGVGEIQAPVDAVKKVIDEDYKTWDDGLKQYETLEESVDEATKSTIEVCYSRYDIGGGFMVKDRDFVIREVCTPLPGGGYVIFAESVGEDETFEGTPNNRGVIRAWAGPSGWVLIPTIDGFTHVTYLTQTDLKGKLPGFLANSGSSGQLECVDKVRQLVTKK